MVSTNDLSECNLDCLAVLEDTTNLWHRRLGHLNLKLLKYLQTNVLVKGLPNIHDKPKNKCEPCLKGKQVKSSHKPINKVTTARCLELLHMDLVGPMQTSSLSGKKYILVVIDDYSHFTWVLFLNHKSETFDAFKKLCKRIQKEKGAYISSIRSDRGGEFTSDEMTCY